MVDPPPSFRKRAIELIKQNNINMLRRMLSTIKKRVNRALMVDNKFDVGIADARGESNQF